MKKRIIILILLAILAFVLPFLVGGKTLTSRLSEAVADATPSPTMPVIQIDVPDTEGTHTVPITPTPSPTPSPVPDPTKEPEVKETNPTVPDSGKTPSSATVQKESAFALTIQKQTVQVLPSVDEESLEQAPGWLNSSARPGEEGVCVVYGHRNRHHFKSLKGIDCGDSITVTMPDGTVWNYVVESTEILDSDATLRIPTITGKHLMLTTCYPFYYSGHAPKKFIVIASLITESEL